MGRKKKSYEDAVDSLNPDVEGEGEDMSLEDMGFDEEDAVDVSKKDEPASADAPTAEAAPDATDTAKAPEAASEVGPEETPADEGDAKKPDDAPSAEPSSPEASDEATTASDATASTPADETVSMGDAEYPAVTDTADLSLKDADGKEVEGTATPLPPDAEAAAEKPEDAPEEAEPAVGSPEHLEAAEKAAAEAPAPVDPATLPGMAPCASVGAIEAVSGQPAPMTVIEGLGKDDTVPALGDVHEAAKPIEEALDEGVITQLKDAGDKASEALLQLKAVEQQLESLPEGARALAVQVMAMGLHFISALEGVFKRQ